MKPNYLLRVEANDGFGGTYQKALTVTITDVNEAPVITTHGGGPTAVLSWQENNVSQVAVVTASDPEVPAAQTLTFSKSGPDEARFNLDPSTGVLSLVSALDFENPTDANGDGIYSVTLTVTDNGMPVLSDSQVMVVQITNRNEAPTFIQGADPAHTLDPGGAKTVPGWATAIDDGDSTVTQTLSFTVVQNGGAGIFSTAPAIAPDGTLTYTLNGSIGIAYLYAYVTDDASIGGQGPLNSGTKAFVIHNQPLPDYQVTYTGGNLDVIDLSGNGEILYLYERQGEPGTVRVYANGRRFSVNGGVHSFTETSVNFPMADLNSVTMNAAAGNDTIRIQTNISGNTLILPSLTLHGGTGDDQVHLAHSVTFKPGASLDVNLQDDDANPGADTISLPGSVQLLFSGTGGVTFKCSRGISIGSSNRVQTENGDILMEANQQSAAAGGSFIGVSGPSSTLEATGTGKITVRGRAGTDSGLGIHFAGARVLTQSGDITLAGVAALANPGGGNHGVLLTSAAQVRSLSGHVSVNGQAGGIAGASGNAAIFLDGEVSTTSNGNLTLTATGGNTTGNGSGNYGIYIAGAASKVTTDDGALTINTSAGGGPGSTANHGLMMTDRNIVLSTGGGDLSVTATAGAGQGQGISCPGSVSTQGGKITLHATGSVEGGTGIVFYDSNSSTISGGGDVTLTGTAGTGTLSTGRGVDLNVPVSAGGGKISIIGLAKGAGFGTEGCLLQRPVGTTGTGTITLHGTASTHGNGRGVYINNAAHVTTAGGSISITGIGGGGTQQAQNTGVHIVDATVSGPAAGASLTVHGTGGAGAQQYNHGVEIFSPNGKLLTSGGDISVTGIAGSNGSWNSSGISLISTAQIRAGGDGDLTLVGQGGGTQSSHGLTLTSGSVGVDGAGDISITGTGSGTGSGISFNQGFTTNGGDITLSGTAGADGGAGISQSMGAVTANGGDIKITGVSTGAANARGISVTQPVTTTGTGTITLEGTAAPNGQGIGIYVATTSITTAGGSISFTGTGGGGGSQLNAGIYTVVSTISGPAAGSTLTFHGTGGSSTALYNHGVEFTSSVVQTSGANIAITGIAGASSPDTQGVSIFSSSRVLAGGDGTISVSGTGGATAGVQQHGTWVRGGCEVSTSNGSIYLIGTSGGQSATNSRGIFKDSSATITAGGSGDLYLTADNMGLSNGTPLTATGNHIYLRQKTTGTPISLGVNDTVSGGPLVLGLSDGELNLCVADEVRIGDANSGDITIAGSIAPTSSTTVLRVARALSFTSAGTFTSLISSDSIFGKLLVNGAITIDPAASVAGSIQGGFIPSTSAVIPIIQNLGAGTTSGTFVNKPQGSVVSLSGLTRRMRITYASGPDSNDIAFYSAPVINLRGNGVVIANGDMTPTSADNTDFGTVTTPGPNISTLYFSLDNVGSADLTNVAVAVGAGTPNGVFSLAGPVVPTLVPSSGTAFGISFDPAAEGLQSSTVTLTNTAGADSPYSFAVQGTGVSPEIAVEHPAGTDLVDGTASVAFGTVPVSSSTTRTFTIRNIGAGLLNITGHNVDGAHAGDFQVTTAPASTVASSGYTELVVTFSPLATGSRTAVLHIANTDANENPFDIVLTGIAGNSITGTLDGVNPVVTTTGVFVCTGLSVETKLGFIPVPNTTYPFIHADGGIIGHFNDLPNGGVIAMAFNGVIYYFQVGYGTNDVTLRNFTPSAAPAWKWVSGPSSRNGVGIYGTLNTAAATNNPGARQGAMNWLARDGTLWMFGGYGYATSVSNPPRYLNDLWQFDRILGQWIWRGGSNAPNQYGVYGTQGTEAPANAPGSRHTGTTWTDGDGNLWLFGGFGVGTTPGAAALNDLWRFNMSTGRWTWMKGSTVTNAAAVYGTQGLAGVANTPGARSSATGFHRNGSLWLYGGYNGANSYNDLWRYDIATNQWTWVKGSSTPNQNGVYGEIQENTAATAPGARRDATGWVAQDGTLWMFGGLGLPESGTVPGDLSDLWKYDPASERWTWMKGAKTTGAPAMHGPKDISHISNQPASRSAGSGWSTVDGKFWLVGGFKDSMLTFNDVWIFDPTSMEWTWKQGDPDNLSVAGVYGIQGEASPGNQPGGRFTPSTWVTLNGTLWVFGGGGADSFGNTGRMSDLWSFGIPNPSQTPSDNEFPAAFPSDLIVNAAPSTLDATAGTTAYVPIRGQLSGTDEDGDRIKFSSTSGTSISQGTLTLNANGTWTYTPAFGFTGIASFQFKASDDYGGQSAVKTLIITVITNPADSDGDGIADDYERRVWGDLAAADADGDADRDGQSNYFEFLAQTNPLDGGERLLTAPTVNAQGAVLSLNHVRPGVNYHLETSSNLKEWSRLGTFTFQQAGSATIEPETPPVGEPVFYRVSLEATPAIIVP